MVVKEVSSARVAKIAAKGLKHPEKLTLDEIMAVCASALTQFEKPAKTAPAKKTFKRKSPTTAPVKRS